MKKIITITLFSILSLSIYSQNQIDKDDVQIKPPTTFDAKIVKKNIKNGNIIVGSLDWFKLPKNSQQKSAFSSVGMLEIPNINSRCTGFLIADNIVMTNNHCVKNDFEASEVKLIMSYEHNSSYSYQYSCDELIKTNEKLDYSILKCKGNPGKKYGKIKFSKRDDFQVQQPVIVIQQNCDYFNEPDCYPLKKISEGKLIYIDENGNRYYYNADTLGGSSGSPVLYRGPNTGDYFLLALHNMGYGSDSEGRGTYNSGVNGLKIYNEIKEYIADDPTSTKTLVPIGYEIVNSDSEIVFNINTDNYILSKDKNIYKLYDYKENSGQNIYKSRTYINKLKFSKAANMYYTFFNRQLNNGTHLYTIEIRDNQFEVYYHKSRTLRDSGKLNNWF